MKYTDKKFSSPANNARFRDNYDRIFSNEQEEKAKSPPDGEQEEAGRDSSEEIPQQGSAADGASLRQARGAGHAVRAIVTSPAALYRSAAAVALWKIGMQLRPLHTPAVTTQGTWAISI